MTKIWVLVVVWFVQGKPETTYIKQTDYRSCMQHAELEAIQGNGLAYCVLGYAKQIHEYER